MGCTTAIIRTTSIVALSLMILWAIAIIVMVHVAVPPALRHVPFFDAIPISSVVGATLTSLTSMSGLLAFVRRTSGPCTGVFIAGGVLEIFFCLGMGVAFVMSNHQIVDYSKPWKTSSEEAKCFYEVTYSCSGWLRPCGNGTHAFDNTTLDECPSCAAFMVVAPPIYAESCARLSQRSLDLTEWPTVVVLSAMMTATVVLMTTAARLAANGGEGEGGKENLSAHPPLILVTANPAHPTPVHSTPVHPTPVSAPSKDARRHTKNPSHRGQSSSTAPPVVGGGGGGAAGLTPGPRTSQTSVRHPAHLSPRASRTAVSSSTSADGGLGSSSDESGAPPQALIDFDRVIRGR